MAACARTRALSPRMCAALIAACDSLEAVWTATEEYLIHAGISHECAKRFCKARAHISPQHELELLNTHAIEVVTQYDAVYPALLRHLPDPPPALFVRGNLNGNLSHPLAVVGARAMSSYGAQALSALIPPLVSHGCNIISGLALGCDSRAHEETLAHHGYTIAVLGGGIDDASVYPRQNVTLAKKILSGGGALISEYPPETKPEAFHFPARNRIIAGCAEGVLVPEAASASGSLITARLGLDYNRNVYAVPGSIFARQCEGTNELITMGAKPVRSAHDILIDFGITPQVAAPERYTPENEEEKKILSLLSPEPLNLDSLIVRSLLSPAQLLSRLTILESKHIVEQIEPGKFVKRIL